MRLTHTHAHTHTHTLPVVMVPLGTMAELLLTVSVEDMLAVDVGVLVGSVDDGTGSAMESTIPLTKWILQYYIIL